MADSVSYLRDSRDMGELEARVAEVNSTLPRTRTRGSDVDALRSAAYGRKAELRGDALMSAGSADEARLRSMGDPAVEYFGSAEGEDPDRLRAIKDDLESGSVEIVTHDREDECIGYSPAGPGGLGARLHATEGMSLSAWEHEHDHYLFDREHGFPGIGYYLRNSEEWDSAEVRAYGIEIEMARQAGYNELVDRLRDNLEKDQIRRGRRG